MFLICSISSFIVFVFYASSFEFKFYSHFIISQIVHGVSGGKIYFILIYFSVCFLVLHFKKNCKPAASINKKILWTSILFIIIGMLSSFCSWFYYIMKYDLPIGSYTFHFNGIYNSMNYFPHIHTSKIYLYRIAALTGLDRFLLNMDDGRVFVNVIPIFYQYLTAISTVSLIVLFTFYLIPFIVSSWDKRFRTGIAVIAVCVCHSIIKCLSDGGPFAYDFLIGSGILSVLINSRNAEEIIQFLKKRKKVFFWVIFLTLSLLFCLDPCLGILTYTLKHGSALLAILMLIFFITIKKEFKKGLIFTLMILVLSLYAIYNISAKYFVYIKPFLSFIDSGTVVHYFYYNDGKLPDTLKNSETIFKDDFVDIYRYKTEKKERILEIYKALNENPYRDRHLAIMPAYRNKVSGMFAEMTILRLNGEKIVLPTIGIFQLNLTKKDLDKMNFYAVMAFHSGYFPCLTKAEDTATTLLDENHRFVMYYFVNRYLNYYGIKEYIFIPFGFYSDP
jgi:hypothetical protein